MIQKNSFENYKIEFTNSAKKDLKKLDQLVVDKVNDVLRRLVAGHPNVDVIKMQGYDDTYRIRCGKYRVVFQAHRKIITIYVVNIDLRKDIYKDF